MRQLLLGYHSKCHLSLCAPNARPNLPVHSTIIPTPTPTALASNRTTQIHPPHSIHNSMFPDLRTPSRT